MTHHQSNRIFDLPVVRGFLGAGWIFRSVKLELLAARFDADRVVSRLLPLVGFAAERFARLAGGASRFFFSLGSCMELNQCSTPIAAAINSLLCPFK